MGCITPVIRPFSGPSFHPLSEVRGDGADAVGGADLMFDVELFVVVVLFVFVLAFVFVFVSSSFDKIGIVFTIGMELDADLDRSRILYCNRFQRSSVVPSSAKSFDAGACNLKFQSAKFDHPMDLAWARLSCEDLAV